MQSSQVRHVLGEQIIELDEGFEWASTFPSQFQTPTDIDGQVNFKPAIVPGTVGMLVQDETQLAALNDVDHWYRIEFSMPQLLPANTILQLGGLLTLADVFLNGHLILQSSNAYHVHHVDVSDKLLLTNQLFICFRALSPLLASKHPRGRFITRLINERNLRFVRTPLLGFMPGFAPITKLVGPYRPIKLIVQTEVIVVSATVNAVLMAKEVGEINVNIVLVALQPAEKAPLYEACFLVLIDSESKQEIKRTHLPLYIDANGNMILAGQLTADVIEAYWPHTHGHPKRYQLNLELVRKNKTSCIVNLGQYGFRKIERVNEQIFSLKINDIPLFLRGACWTPMDINCLYVAPEKLRERLLLLRDAGLNMLRVPGNMLYEQDEFYEICDELGILIFQDFAFANFDYPDDNADFAASVQREVETFLAKHGNRACMAVLAGNSEVQQQASMMGLPLAELKNKLFDAHLPAIAQAFAPNAIYVSSSPSSQQVPFHAGTGAPFHSGIGVPFHSGIGVPFHSGIGPSHYYGVGGYKRSFDDARLFKGKFASECLAFSHVPEDASLRTFFDGEILPTHHPQWKEGVARDNGAGWDFSDITDFYVEKLFGVNTAILRAVDQTRYLDYCRAATVEVVERTMSIFRADSSEGRAALVWFLHDIKPGAGWGYIDVLGQPKSAFYGLARVAQPTTVVFVDEGLEGLALYMAHDGAESLNCELALTLVTANGQIFEQQKQVQVLQPRSVSRISVDSFLGRFVDSSYAYQFGPRSFVSCVASLKAESGHMIVQKIYADSTVTHVLSSHVGLSASTQMQADGSYLLRISSTEPAFFVVIDIPFFQPSDNYFHVMPGFDQHVLLKPQGKQAMPRGKVRALNAMAAVAVQVITTT